MIEVERWRWSSGGILVNESLNVVGLNTVRGALIVVKVELINSNSGDRGMVE